MINSYTATVFKTAILKYDVSDHFPICLIIPSSKFSSKNEYIYILTFNEQSIINFKKNVFEIDWQEIKALQNPWNAYTYFLEQFLRLYDRDKKNQEKSFEKICKILGSLMALKNLLNISSVCMIIFLKMEMKNKETKYKNYKNLFEAITKCF